MSSYRDLAICAGLCVVTVVAVSSVGGAASLGTAGPQGNGVTGSVVGACLTSPGVVTVSWNGSVDFVTGAQPHFTTDSIKIADYGTACRQRSYKLSISASSGSSAFNSSGTVPNASNFSISLPDVSASQISRVELVIY